MLLCICICIIFAVSQCRHPCIVLVGYVINIGAARRARLRMREILNPGWSDSRTLVGRGAGRAAVDRISTGAMFAINVFSLILIHVLSVVVLSTCRNEYTATNVSAVGVTVSPVYSGSTDCDCKCDVSVNTAAQNLPVTAGKLRTY